MSITSKRNIKSYQVNLDEYSMLHTIKEGGFGIVYLVENKTSHQKVAAKVNLKSGDADIAREISILIRIQAPTIIKLHGFSFEDFTGFSRVTILMDYKENGSLKKYIELEQQCNLPPEYDNTTKQIILCGIAHGMMVLHSRRIIHRDLKPENILLDSQYRPFITDFGVSKFLDPNNSKSQSMRFVGTLAYMSPEQFEGYHYGPKADVYSFGILMYEVISGNWAYPELLHSKYTFFSFGQLVINGKRPEIRGPIPPRFQELIKRCLDKDPRKRPTFRELFNKLSLSLDFDDELIEEKLTDELSTPCGTEEDQEEDEDEEGDYRYCLPGVDHERVLDYVYDITNSSSTSDNEELYQTIESQYKRINQLEKHNQSIKLRLEEIEKKHQEEINYLKQCLIDIQNQLKTQKSTDTTTESKSNTNLNDDEGGQLSNGLEEFIKDNQDKSLRKITIPSTVTSLGNFSFSNFNHLRQIEVDSANPNYASIDGILFSKDLRTIVRYPIRKDGDSYTIPSTVTSLANEAFTNCRLLKQVAIPSSVTSIGKCPFTGCVKLEKVFVDSSNPNYVSIESILFSKKSKTLICFPCMKKISLYSIPSSVTSIGDDAFSWCGSLTQITIPLSVTSIGNNAFSYCSSLTQITIPSSVTSIGDRVFFNCFSLTRITIPSSVTSIGEYAFFSCRSVLQVTIPSSVTSIGNGAFSDCSSLTQITIPSSVTSITGCAFFGCSRLEEIFVDSNNPNYDSIDYILFTKDIRILIRFPPKKDNKTYTIPSSVTSIGDYAFSGCSSLTQITIPSSVTSIGDSAFSDCSSLTEIIIPSSVTSIGDRAFSNCRSLTHITIPSSVTSIGEYAFSNCSSLTHITIPSSVISIGKYALYQCTNLNTSLQSHLIDRYGHNIICSHFRGERLI